MSEYHKINSVYKRDVSGKKMLFGEFSCQEFAFLADNEWSFTEKVDGTNIRIIIPKVGAVTFRGKTDNAQIPTKLNTRLQERFLSGSLLESLPNKFPEGAVFYGEGFGAGIQSGGSYRADQDFVLFDVRIGEWWLNREDAEEIAASLKIEIVPVIGYGTLRSMEEKVRQGFSSQWGDFKAEGIVARPRIELRTRSNERIITKLKFKDFK